MTRSTDVIIRQAEAAIQANDFAQACALLEPLAQSDSAAPEILETLADAYERSDQTINALRTLDRIIGNGAATAATWQQTGQLLTGVREYGQAVGAFAESVALDANQASVRHDYARVLYKLGDLSGAAEQLEWAVKLTDAIDPWIALATLAPHHPGYDHADVFRIRQTLAEKLPKPTIEQPVSRPCSLAGQLRIGYLSSWFDRENYMKPVWGLINHHDRSQFEIHLFTDSSADNGIPGYQPHPNDQVHETGKLDNTQLHSAIRRAEIDILIDLNAYSTPERLGVFLANPAPVTVAWFNMYATSGLPGFDYIVGDNITVRPDEEEFYSEKVLRLPQSYLTFTVTHDAPPIVAPPCIQNGFMTFGSLVTQYKLTTPVLDAWAEILRAVPTSRLLLGNTELDSSCNRDFVAARFVDRGIDPGRIEFRGRAEHWKFLEYYNSIDIALDAFPYNGGTTTMEAIWQGVPVISFDGDRWASRTSASILSGTHLTKFVASDQKGYVRTAVELASEKNAAQRLQTLRQTMRESLDGCAACDSAALALAMESLYCEIANRDAK